MRGVTPEARGGAYVVVLRYVDTPAGRLALKEPRMLPLVREGDRAVLAMPELGITAHGATYREAEEALQAELAWLWREYVCAPQDELSQDAQELARRLRALVVEA